jgi:hypothetical protein
MNYLKAFCLPIKHLKGIETGWGNGYIAIPEGHQLHGLDYSVIENEYGIYAHGGLTFSGEGIKGQPDDTKGMWIIGFDCCHFGDNRKNCSKDFVHNETIDLLNQCIEIGFLNP